MEKLKRSMALISKNFFNKDVFSELLVGSVDDIKGTTALMNRKTGLLVAPNKTGGYNVYLNHGGEFEIYARDIDEKTASVCALLSYIEIFVENHLYSKHGSFDYLDSLEFGDDNKNLSLTMGTLNEALLMMGAKSELFFDITGVNKIRCFGMDFGYEKVNKFISRGDDLYAWEIVDKKDGQIISADFKNYDNGILQSILMGAEKKMFLLVDEVPQLGNVINIKKETNESYEP